MSIVVVLSRSQNLINIALVIRSMRNFGLRDLRLVDPLEFDPHRVEGIAHGTGDVIERVRTFDTFDEAISDCQFVVGMTARHRTARHTVGRVRDSVPQILEEAQDQAVAIVLGPEHNGLSNEELERCHLAVTIDTTDEHTSLNLAHAFTIMAYELFLAGGNERDFKPPRRLSEAATAEDLELLFEDAEKSLDAIDFFKSRKTRSIMRTVRNLVLRARPDGREARLLRGMALEVRHFLARLGAGESKED